MAVSRATAFDVSRRRLLARGLMGLGAVAVMGAMPGRALAQMLDSKMANGATVRALSFHNLHTDEKLSTIYWKDGEYDRAALAQINHILRDHYSGDEREMDVALIDTLHDVQGLVENDRPVQIISGYRSPVTNNRLREAKGDPAQTGVAKNSYHMRGMATDLRFEGVPLARLHDIALGMQRGGVGYYPASDFVHMDVGPLRHWG